MYCAACGKKTPDDPCPYCGSSVMLRGRWRFEEVAGSGTFGTTWRALDTQTGFTVAVKECRVAGLSDKVVQLAQREAAVLAQLDHPAIPRFVEAFEQGSGRSRRLYLVTEFIHGLTLEQERERRRYTEDDVLDLAEELLGILRYLHGLSPPVVHRDIKPSNLIRRAPGNRLVLIDFGAVRDALTEGSTTVGTFGYMAPEQGVGGGSPASDLYALGALMVVCLTREEPKKLANRRGQLEWHGKANVRARTARLLDGLLEADPDKRPDHAHVRAELRAARKEPAALSQTVTAAAPESSAPRRGAPPGPVGPAKRGGPPGPVGKAKRGAPPGPVAEPVLVAEHAGPFLPSDNAAAPLTLQSQLPTTSRTVILVVVAAAGLPLLISGIIILAVVLAG